MSDLDLNEFRHAGHAMVDWVADYFANIRDYPVMARVEPGELAASLPASAPAAGEPLDAIFADFQRLVLPAVTHWNHPRFFAYFSVSASVAGILADLLSSTLNVNGMVWKSCPAVTELEVVTMDWLRQWLGLPEGLFGMIHDTASLSTMHAIAAARAVADPEARAHGASRGLTLYTSEQAHSSVEKGALALGIGQENVRKIAVDDAFRMRVDALEAAIAADLAAGKKPFCVVPTTGTTSTSSIDPVEEIGRVARAHGLWMHVDAAYGGGAAIVPEFRHVLRGCELADSIVVNPHKWMFTPIDLSAFYTRRPEVLRQAFSLVPEYLRTSEDGRAVNLMDYGVPLGRRFRALKLWFVMRAFGHDGAAALVREHIHMARELESWIAADERFELCAPVPLSLVCFRKKGGDEENQRLVERVNATGRAFLSHTALNGRYVIRFAIGNMRTTRDDIRQAWDLIRDCAGDS